MKLLKKLSTALVYLGVPENKAKVLEIATLVPPPLQDQLVKAETGVGPAQTSGADSAHPSLPAPGSSAPMPKHSVTPVRHIQYGGILECYERRAQNSKTPQLKGN